jgi:hypothetical protein
VSNDLEIIWSLNNQVCRSTPKHASKYVGLFKIFTTENLISFFFFFFEFGFSFLSLGLKALLFPKAHSVT